MTNSKLTAGGLILVALLAATGVADAGPKPKLSKLIYDSINNELKVTGSSKASKVNLYDAVADQWLAEQTPVNGKFSFTLSNLPTTPCSLRIEADGASVLAKLSKAPACAKGDLPPVCKIVTPSADKQINFGETISFVGSAVDPDKTALYYEWDFGGGASARPTSPAANDIKFDAHNNTVYNVSFTATDLSGRRCSDRLKVTVGNILTAPAKVAEQPVAKNGLDSSEYVVLPYTPFSMEFHDLSYKGMPQMYPIAWLNAVALKKGSVGGAKPALLDKNTVKLHFSAASNPSDPVGKGSINSTSQNYPPNTAYGAATIKKTDFYDPCEFTGGDKGVGGAPTVRGAQIGTVAGTNHPITSASCSFGQFNRFDPNSTENTFGAVEVLPDEGQRYYDPGVWSSWNGDIQVWNGYLKPTGVPMPGIAKPYIANDPQAFNVFDANRSVFEADGMVLFPTDDQGRHNPYPLMRVQAEADGKVLATGDAVIGVSTEFNCAECHSYYGNDKPQRIGADQIFYDKLKKDVAESAEGSELAKYKAFAVKIPKFVKPEDLDAARKDDRDIIEQAAMRNIVALHDFTYSFARGLNDPPSWMSEKEWPGWTMLGRPATNGTQDSCGNFCHRSDPKVNESWAPMTADSVSGGGGACPEYSNSLHNTHGRMLGKLNADFTGTLERLPITGGFIMADLTKKPDPAHPFLLEVKDSGTPDSSCLFCHQGKQDKYQRDVMTAAGVNCIDCHGDMAVLAGGTAMTSRAAGDNPPDNNIKTKFEHLPRHPYRDGLPSCASCHTGMGDEPVLRRSYDMSTGTFKPLPVKNERFAENLTPKLTDEVIPNSNNSFKPVEVAADGQSCPPGTFTDTLESGKNVCERGLFRNSLDRHAKLPCASCHGATHSTWPNPDPYANDNVTAMQLQGHTGTILECSACHTTDAFKTVESIGSSLHYPDKAGNPTILAGPHNTHPINDAYWVNKDGGFHNQWAKKPGLNGEDQCATCHGKDHKGTRLSKTPVDRVFTTGKTKKFKKVTVKAGTQIGCDLCHS
ncbi:MAG: hypothetical protein ABL925_13105, partial [Methylococcales bacterium]